MLALIDADILVYRVGYTTNNEAGHIAIYRLEDMIDRILETLKTNEYRAFLSDSTENGFRFQIDKSYKANRTAPKPVHYDLLKEHFISEWGAVIALGMEADDYIGIHQDKSDSYSTIICSIDKDLHQIPGLYFNFVDESIRINSVEAARLFFYRQLLIGDTSDNIKGATGIGKVKAEKALPDSLVDVAEIEDRVVEAYKKAEKGKTLWEIEQHILKIGKLLKIKQHPEEPLWHFEQYEPKGIPMQSSTQQVPVETGQSTELTGQESVG